MLDRLRLFVPFRPEFITGGSPFVSAADAIDSGHVGLVDLNTLNVPLQASLCPLTRQPQQLRHAWESLPTSFTGVAMKIHNDPSHYPGVELKASPAKILQGHNVFGPTDIGQGGSEMLTYLSVVYPGLYDRLAVESTEVWELDATYSSRLPDHTTALQVLQALNNVSNGQTKPRGDHYATTSYFGKKDSRLRKLKLYLKEPEFIAQFSEMQRLAERGDVAAQRVVAVMSEPRLSEWVRNLLRMEATVMKRWLERRDIPTNWVALTRYQRQLAEQGRCFIRECWQAVTQDIFQAFAGVQMKIVNDDQVLQALKATHVRFTKAGKPSYQYARNLFRTFELIRDYGWDGAADRVCKATFHRHVVAIARCGVTKAYLQNLHATQQTQRVFPLMRFVAVDFSAQRPSWYRDPVSQFLSDRAA